MKNSDLLLKKAALFEKLAVYGDRRSFLRAHAQRLPGQIADKIDNTLKDLSATKPESVNLQNKLMSFLIGSKSDLNELGALLEEAANTIPGDHMVQVQNALNLAREVRQMAAGPDPEVVDSTMVMPEDKIIGYAPIPKNVQDHLSELVTAMGWGIPIEVDGKIGKYTRQALNNFKKILKMPMGTPDAQTFAAIEKAYNSYKAKDFSWVPAAQRQKEEYEKSQSFPPGTLPK